MYHAQRRYTDAEPLFKRSLAIRDKAFGPDHLSAAASLEDYAALMSDTGRPAEASEMEARAKAIWTKLAEGGLPATVAAPYVKAGIQETHKSAAAAPRV